MKKLFTYFLGSTLVAALCCPLALADSFAFTFTGSTDNGSGVFTTQSTANTGQLLITAVSGVTDGQSISALFLPGTYPPAAPDDNLLFFTPSAGAFLDFAGVSYALTDGTMVNLFYDPVVSAYFVDVNNNGGFSLDFFSVTPVTPTTPMTPDGQVPEPNSLALLGTGALGVVEVVRRRFRV